MFRLDYRTKIEYSGGIKSVENVCNILRRDIERICINGFSKDKGLEGVISLKNDIDIEPEMYRIEVCNDSITIFANDDFGFEYALLYISEKYLGVKPFWFWNEQKFIKKDYVDVPIGVYYSEKKVVRYRGWFYNDEVLMMGWSYNDLDKAGWHMAFEALLRCGGNMCIPGTDKLARENAEIAARDYGLWITHHHAEPLGAEMFARTYPDLEADYFKYPDKFRRLWEEAVIRQKDYKVIWNLCFRGQGDCPFWSNNSSELYDTDEKRGKVISEIIKIQADIVKKYVKDPIFCTNLYGEIMELYKEGYITFPDGIILVRADNGYGRMVTRRRGNHNPRVNAMPEPLEKNKQGIYYHVSFYDLQAASQISMLPNTVNLVNNELNNVISNGGSTFWIINCSNVKPHTYFLDAIRKKWSGEDISDEVHAREYVEEYYKKENAKKDDEKLAQCYVEYASASPVFGEHEDEHAGEQFYTENIRYFVNYILQGKTGCVKELIWLTGEKNLDEQLKLFNDICLEKKDAQERLYAKTANIECILGLHVKMHYFGTLGVNTFFEAYKKMKQKDYEAAFYLFGKSAEYFDTVDKAMKESVTGIWEGFYDNECQADYKFTAYLIRKLRGLMREFGDNSGHYNWQYKYLCSKEDRGVRLILLTRNHATDEEIYRAMCEHKEMVKKLSQNSR